MLLQTNNSLTKLILNVTQPRWIFLLCYYPYNLWVLFCLKKKINVLVNASNYHFFHKDLDPRNFVFVKNIFLHQVVFVRLPFLCMCSELPRKYNCNILTYISSINTWASGDSPLAAHYRPRLVFISVCNQKAVSSRHSRTNQ